MLQAIQICGTKFKSEVLSYSFGVSLSANYLEDEIINYTVSIGQSLYILYDYHEAIRKHDLLRAKSFAVNYGVSIN